MKISPDGEPLPPPKEAAVDDTSSVRDERRLMVISLAEHVLANWGRTTRVIAIAVVVLGLVIFGLWLLPVDLQMGPLRLFRN